ncbi:MAG: hypothetical protein J7L96_04270 [Bacteroidales bacterium]|nr:hypothetical protein [Bacteroidales bacterium]
MSWKDPKQPGDIIKATDWNEQASVVIQTSGAFWAHSGNTSNPHKVTLEQARAENNVVSGSIDMNGNNIVNLAQPLSLNDAATKLYVDRVVTSLGAAYYMTDDTDTETGYKLCSLTPPDASEAYIQVSNLSNDQLIGAWISALDEAPARLLKGVFGWFPTLEKVAGTQTLRVYWKLFERSGSTETEIATSADSNEVDGKASYIIPLLLSDDYILSSGSRVVGKLYARVEGTGSSPTIRVYYQGNTASRWEIPANSETFRKIFVPYSGALYNVNLGSNQLTAETLEASSLVLDGYTIDEISNDTNLSDDSPTALITEHAVRTFAFTNFYPSSEGHSLNEAFYSHTAETNKHIDHSTVYINAGEGLSGGGDITQSRTLSVAGYSAISSNASSGQKALSWLNASGSNYHQAYAHSLITSGNPHDISISDLSDVVIDSITEGHSLIYLSNQWKNCNGPITFSTPAIGLRGNRYVNLARFITPSGKQLYTWMAQVSDINGNYVSGLRLELLSGNTVVYSTSSNIVEIGSPLATTSGDITIRIIYSGAGIGEGDDVRCLGFMQVSII